MFAASAHADGIPEPGMIFYGAVLNSAEGNGRLTVGSLNWTVTSSAATSLTLTTPVTNLDGTNSYRLRIPYETLVGGNTGSARSFVLNSGTTAYGNSGIKFFANGSEFPINVTLSAAVYNFSAANRGLVMPLDLTVNAPGVRITGGPRIRPPDTTSYHGGGGGNGASPLQFTAIEAHPKNGIVVQWTGAPTDRSYFLLRAQTVDSELGTYEVVKSFSPSAVATQSFWDTNTVNTASYFYRLLVQ